MGSLSFQALTVLKPQTDTNFSWINLAALLGMVVVTVGCLFCVVVLSQQVYLLNRIMTGGVSGFDLAKTLFAKDYRWVRHIGVFFLMLRTLHRVDSKVPSHMLCSSRVRVST